MRNSTRGPSHIDIIALILTLNVSEAVIAARLSAWKAPELRYKRSVMAKYANSVTSASLDAVTT